MARDASPAGRRDCGSSNGQGQEEKEAEDWHGKHESGCTDAQSDHLRVPAERLQVSWWRSSKARNFRWHGRHHADHGLAGQHDALHDGRFTGGLDDDDADERTSWTKSRLASANSRSQSLCRSFRPVHVQLVPAQRAHAHVVDTLQIVRERHGLLCRALEQESGSEANAGVHCSAAQARLGGRLRQGIHRQAQEGGAWCQPTHEARGCRNLQDQEARPQRDGRNSRDGRNWYARHGGLCRSYRYHGYVYEQHEAHHRREERGQRVQHHRRIPHKLPQRDGRRRLAVQGYQCCSGAAFNGHKPSKAAASRVHPQVRGGCQARGLARWLWHCNSNSCATKVGCAVLPFKVQAHLAAHQSPPLRCISCKGSPTASTKGAAAVHRI
mmetsp:Transcript_105763/g.188140  ORF Transcript_105763/g.188140 Transcript_105763/m.188140 type:complete len:382 (+) Transcript_105763:1361-2506(+)